MAPHYPGSLPAPRRDARGTAYLEQGSGTPLLLLHGVGLSAAMWGPVMPALAASHRVIAPDMLGHGASPLPGADVRLADYARQAVALLDELGIASAGVAGFSMGALVTQRLAIDFPARVSRVAFVSGVCERSTEESLAVIRRALAVAVSGVAPSVEPALARWFSPAFRAEHPEWIEWVRATMLANDPTGYLRSYATFATGDAELAGELPAIKAPTLVVTGAQDGGSTAAMAQRMQQRIRGARLEIIAAGRHLLPIEMPQQLLAILRPFFEKGAT
jgi:pimeloyl-ACP methyl ester carboxylesterase